MDTSNKQVDAAMAALRKRALAGDAVAPRQLGRVLFAARYMAGLSIRDVSEAYGPAESTISQVERGERIPNKVTMIALLDVYRQHCEIGVLDGRVWVGPR